MSLAAGWLAGLSGAVGLVGGMAAPPLIRWIVPDALGGAGTGPDEAFGEPGAGSSLAKPGKSGRPGVVAEVVIAGLAGVFLALASYRTGLSPALLAFFVLDVFLAAVVVTDLATHRIPVRLVYPALALVVVFLVLNQVVGGRSADLRPLLDCLYGGLIGFGLMTLLHLVNPRGLGFGDVRLVGVIGVVLGRLGLTVVLDALVVGFLLAALVGIGVLVVAGRAGRKAKLPFAPFLAVGTLVAVGLPVVLTRF